MIRYYLSYYPWEIEQNFNNSRNNTTNEILLLLRSPVWGCYSLTGLQDDGIDLGLTLDGFVCDFRTMHEEEALGARAPLAAVALWPWSRDGPLSHR